MKLDNLGINTQLVVLPRGDKDLVFKIRAILSKDYDDFNKLCPEPVAPLKTERGKQPVYDIEDTDFRNEVKDYSARKLDYMFIKSLSETESLVWETVNLSDSSTWKNYEKELEENLTPAEINYLKHQIFCINGLSSSYIEEAKKRFTSTVAQEKA